LQNAYLTRPYLFNDNTGDIFYLALKGSGTMSSVMLPSIEEVFSLVAQPLESVKASLMAIVPPESVALAESVQHSLSGGGKYLRPVATLLTGAATGPQSEIQRHQTCETAAVAEMIHVATLLHDDVIDHSELRRGRQTVRAVWGNKISVLSGDYLLAQASVKLSRLNNNRLVSIFAHVLADLCDGEVEQLHASYTLEASWDSYYKKTICKTASLFSAGCESAGVINQLPEEQIQALKTYGRNFGIAFQIMDDLLDYTATEAEMGKPVLDDLRNGLMNAPVLIALESERLSETEQAALREHIQKLFEDPANDMHIAAIQDALNACDALAETRALARRYIDEASQALDFVPDSIEKQALLTLLDYIVQRRN
jgi:all-trans-nonaprenyl-diphosphate synthase